MDFSVGSIQKLMKYSSYAVIAWVSSWIIFFITLPFVVNIFGKVHGATINYALSWITPIPILVGLEYYHNHSDTVETSTDASGDSFGKIIG